MIDIEERDELAVQRGFGLRDARRLWPFVKDDWPLLAGAALLTVAGAGLAVAQPILIMSIIDEAIRNGRADLLLVLIAAYLGVALGNWTVGVLHTRFMGRMALGTLYRMRTGMFIHLQVLSMSFYDRTKVGRIISRLTSDIGALNSLITGGVVSALGSVLSLSGILIAMLALKWQLALLAFTVLPLLTLFLRWFTPRSRLAWRAVRERTSAVNAALAESILGVRVIQAMAREDVNIELFDKINWRNFQAGKRAGLITATLPPTVDVLSAVGTAVVIGVGGSWILSGAVDGLTVGLLAAFTLYMEQFFGPLRELSSLFDSFQNAAASGERVFALLDLEPAVVDAPDATDLTDVRGEVRYDHITFGYDPDEPVIHGIDLQVMPGETVALVGATGSGKTTLASLALRFYDVTGGAVRIDGEDVRQVTQASLRRHIGVVLQEPFIFAGSLRENITYGRPDASEEAIQRAVEVANLRSLVERTPFGLDTPLAERGAGLSLGERQLISFARAVLTDPKILILDEATSSIDTETERLVQQALQRLLEQRTAIVIAHRLSTIESADRIVVLSQGRIVEQGNHHELMARQGHYYRLRQLGVAETDEIGAELLTPAAERT